MPRPRLVLICLFVVAATIAYRLGKESSKKAKEIPQSPVFLPRNHSEKAHVYPKLARVVETNGQKTDSNDDIDAVLESMNPQNDWIASLNSARRDKLLSKIDVSGIEIIDQIPELGIIRFSVTESRKSTSFTQ